MKLRFNYTGPGEEGIVHEDIYGGVTFSRIWDGHWEEDRSVEPADTIAGLLANINESPFWEVTMT